MSWLFYHLLNDDFFVDMSKYSFFDHSQILFFAPFSAFSLFRSNEDDVIANYERKTLFRAKNIEIFLSFRPKNELNRFFQSTLMKISRKSIILFLRSRPRKSDPESIFRVEC